MFKILSRPGNANQNDTEIPSHPSLNGYHQENKQQMLDVEGGILKHCWWGCKLI
jgi:hypothetical protein